MTNGENGNAAALDSELLPNGARQDAELRSLEIAKRMAPRGGLGLSRLLDERRLEFGITDAAFKAQAVYDRILVFQIPMIQGDTFEGSTIVMPDTTKAREMNGAPRAVVVSAGPIALDSMRSNGIDLGHIVLFVNAAPFHIRHDTIRGKAMHLIVLTAGDIVASEDLATKLRNREVRVLTEEAIGSDGVTRHTHVLIDERGKHLLPSSAWRAED